MGEERDERHGREHKHRHKDRHKTRERSRERVRKAVCSYGRPRGGWNGFDIGQTSSFSPIQAIPPPRDVDDSVSNTPWPFQPTARGAQGRGSCFLLCRRVRCGACCLRCIAATCAPHPFPSTLARPPLPSIPRRIATTTTAAGAAATPPPTRATTTAAASGGGRTRRRRQRRRQLGLPAMSRSRTPSRCAALVGWFSIVSCNRGGHSRRSIELPWRPAPDLCVL
jgi:hypothetical protein